MVLGPQGPGRVGRRQANRNSTIASAIVEFFAFHYMVLEGCVGHMIYSEGVLQGSEQ